MLKLFVDGKKILFVKKDVKIKVNIKKNLTHGSLVFQMHVNIGGQLSKKNTTSQKTSKYTEIQTEKGNNMLLKYYPTLMRSREGQDFFLELKIKIIFILKN